MEVKEMLRTGEKSQIKGQASSNKPCCPVHVPQSIQTHILPGVEKPDPRVKGPRLTTSDVS